MEHAGRYGGELSEGAEIAWESRDLCLMHGLGDGRTAPSTDEMDHEQDDRNDEQYP